MPARTAGDPEETIDYSFAVDKELWTDWKVTVPRDIKLHDRIAELIEQDKNAGQSGGWNDMEEKTARLLANRMKHQARAAKQQLDDPPESVTAKLDKIEEIATAFEE